MKFAVVDNYKAEPSKGAKGFCPNCGAELIAKCGEIKIHHWAHKGIRSCDPWWENETEWHRAWKGNFPIEWQEVVQYNNTGEKHIADICTSEGLVIEFQHSYIKPEEQKSREEFYKKMIWIVDGARLKMDYSRFVRARETFITTNKPRIYAVNSLTDCFPENWLNCSFPVVFDFQNAQNMKDVSSNLYCLFPKQLRKYGIIAEMSKLAFIKSIITDEWSQRVRNFTDQIILSEQNLYNRDEMQIEQMIQRLPQRLREGARIYMRKKLLK